MNAQDQITILTEESDKIKSGLEEKTKQIGFLKESIKIDNKRIKAAEEGIIAIKALMQIEYHKDNNEH